MKTYAGFLEERCYGEADDILFLSTSEEPLADELVWMSGKEVTVRYWITDKECSKEKAIEFFIRQLYGDAEVLFGSCYSECTGYLWTDEDLIVGGHDIIEELHSNIGKWLILEVECAEIDKTTEQE